jgi:hypothetical protein
LDARSAHLLTHVLPAKAPIRFTKVIALAAKYPFVGFVSKITNVRVAWEGNSLME